MLRPDFYTIYIHVPFCRQACSYCDFYFVTRQEWIPEYLNALIREIQQELPFFLKNLAGYNHPQPKLQSVYFGGGTPSRLPVTAIDRILKEIRQVCDFSDVGEITFEVNPDDVTAQVLDGLLNAGITRLSMGIQSFDPALLKFMHRAHSSEQAHNSLKLLAESRFPTWSADLIYGCPDQSADSLRKDLDALLSYDPPHVSAYALTIEPQTRLGRYAALGRLREADDGIVAEQMDMIESQLRSAGIYRYEVSNFAKPGHEARHNSSYWEHVPYLGLGPGAHSLLIGHTAGSGAENPGLTGRRWSNIRDLKAYIRAEAGNIREPEEALNSIELAEERIMMGLRTTKGVSLQELKSVYGYIPNRNQKSIIVALCREQLVKNEYTTLRLTEEGIKKADSVTLAILSA